MSDPIIYIIRLSQNIFRRYYSIESFVDFFLLDFCFENQYKYDLIEEEKT